MFLSLNSIYWDILNEVFYSMNRTLGWEFEQWKFSIFSFSQSLMDYVSRASSKASVRSRNLE